MVAVCFCIVVQPNKVIAEMLGDVVRSNASLVSSRPPVVAEAVKDRRGESPGLLDEHSAVVTGKNMILFGGYGKTG